MKLPKVFKIEISPNGTHGYNAADGILIVFDVEDGKAVDVRFEGYIDTLDEWVDVTELISPKRLLKYQRELQDHIDSWGTDEDERVVDEAKEA